MGLSPGARRNDITTQPVWAWILFLIMSIILFYHIFHDISGSEMQCFWFKCHNNMGQKNGDLFKKS
jgi:hypothetical protein